VRGALSPPQAEALAAACGAVGVEPEPWLAWARAAANLVGGHEATRLAILGAASQPDWEVAPERRRWWRRSPTPLS
jgi:hypothetical protein